MTKKHLLMRHLASPDFHDPPSLSTTLKGDRLRSAFFKEPGNSKTFARTVASLNRPPIVFFPDTNIAFRSDTQEIWDALRLIALGSTKDTTIVSGTVEFEMQEWLADPHSNHQRASDISAALKQKTWLRPFQIAPDDPIYPAIINYVQVLGVRRQLARRWSDGQTPVQTDPNEKCETMNAIRNQVGERAEALAKKGRLDFEKRGFIDLNDEFNCLSMVAYSLRTGNNSMLITADEDLVEIFWKVQWFLDTHYRAWLAAKLVKQGEYGKPVKEITDTDGYFEGGLLLYQRPTSHLCEVLPGQFTPVKSGVTYLAPDNTIVSIAFNFEREMLGLLETRAATGGRCTDLFGDANLHVHLWPVETTVDGLCLGIGKDVGASVELNGVRTFVPRLDLEHALTVRERIVQTQVFTA